jgi:hypothetical protein
VYARRVKGEVLDFGHRGWLYEESFLFYDRQTDSLWVQATGEAVHGTYKGTRLERLPATQTTWSEWLHLHPDTRVLGRYNTVDYWTDSYSSYYETGKGIKYQRNAPLNFGLAVILADKQKLYPFRELEKKPVLFDRIGGEPVLVVFHAASRTAAAFDPRLKDRALQLEVEKSDKDDLVLKDKQTASTWSGLTGRCIAGPAMGAQLRQFTTTQFVIENWRLHYPTGEVYCATGAQGATAP